jgi:hypothetical protein
MRPSSSSCVLVISTGINLILIAAVYLKWVRANETYIWFLFVMSVYVHVAETLIAAALCQRSVAHSVFECWEGVRGGFKGHK